MRFDRDGDMESVHGRVVCDILMTVQRGPTDHQQLRPHPIFLKWTQGSTTVLPGAGKASAFGSSGGLGSHQEALPQEALGVQVVRGSDRSKMFKIPSWREFLMSFLMFLHVFLSLRREGNLEEL